MARAVYSSGGFSVTRKFRSNLDWSLSKTTRPMTINGAAKSKWATAWVNPRTVIPGMRFIVDHRAVFKLILRPDQLCLLIIIIPAISVHKTPNALAAKTISQRIPRGEVRKDRMLSLLTDIFPVVETMN